MTLARMAFDIAWVTLLAWMLWRLKKSLKLHALRAGMIVVPCFVLGQLALYRLTDNTGFPADLSIGSSVVIFGLVTGFDLGQLAPAAVRQDGSDGRFVRHPVPHLVLVAAGLAAVHVIGDTWASGQ